MESYALIVRPQLNKKKVFFAILILLVVIGLCVYSGIRAAQYNHEKEVKNEIEEQEKIAQEENERIRKEEEQRKKEEEAKKLKNSMPLTEVQINSIENIYETVEGQKRAFLTFDDGPTQAVTPFILDLLKQENIKATFFVLGNRAKANPELVKREFEEGHYIANHGYSHKYSQIYENEQNVLDEYNYTNQCVQEALQNPYYNTRVFRFPGGSNGGYYHSIKQSAKQLLKSNNIANLDWNALSKDAEGAKTKEALMQNVIDTVGEKQSVVILMHDASDKILTYETLPDIINYLRQNGYTFMNLYDIL